MSNEHPTPEAIMQLTRAYAGSKALVSAVELGLLTTLVDGPLTSEALMAKLGLQPRGTTDWLDALVSLGILERDGDLYANTAATDLCLDRAKPTWPGTQRRNGPVAHRVRMPPIEWALASVRGEPQRSGRRPRRMIVPKAYGGRFWKRVRLRRRGRHSTFPSWR
jgi:Dimerisation domain